MAQRSKSRSDLLIDLADAVLAGDRKAIARAITIVEDDPGSGNTILEILFPHTGKAHIIGITGPPGTGKSLLVNHMAYLYRHPSKGTKAYKVGIIAIDPTSPFTGGAIMGDRIRMRDLAGDDGIFIRSMATRGALGGLSRQTYAVAQVMDAAGFDTIIIETVGAGQSEVDIVKMAHTVIVVEAPGLGDDIQVIKAGILEIADIIVINKADLDGADQAERFMLTMLNMISNSPGKSDEFSMPSLKKSKAKLWVPPVKKTIALTGEGTEELIQTVHDHEKYLKQSGEWHNRQRFAIENQLKDMVKEELFVRWQEKITARAFKSVINQINERKISPQRAIGDLLQKKE